MGAADMMLLALLGLGDVCLMIHLTRRRSRRMKVERMMRSLRLAIQREVGVECPEVLPAPALVLQRAS